MNSKQQRIELYNIPVQKLLMSPDLGGARSGPSVRQHVLLTWNAATSATRGSHSVIHDPPRDKCHLVTCHHSITGYLWRNVVREFCVFLALIIFI